MKLRVSIDDHLHRRLEAVATGRGPRRVRGVLHRAPWELEEIAIAAAYARQPDSAELECFDPEAWEASLSPGRS